MTEPKLEIEYDELVGSIQDDFVVRGKMKPVKLHCYLTDINDQITVYKEVYGNYLRQEWDTLFPEVKFSENLLTETLNKALTKKRDQAVNKFKKLLKRHKKYRLIFSFIFRKWEARLFGAIFASFITVPVFLSMFFAISDFWLGLGAVGLLINLLTIIFLFGKVILMNKEV